jgi:hypothetical protein
MNVVILSYSNVNLGTKTNRYFSSICYQMYLTLLFKGSCDQPLLIWEGRASIRAMVLNATFKNISATSWRSVLLEGEG